LKKNLSSSTVAFLLISLMFISSFAILSFNIGFAQEESMTFTSGDKISFTSTEEMTIKDYESMEFWSGVQMKFASNITMQFRETTPDGWLDACDWIEIIWPAGYIPPECSWWEVFDPDTGKAIGEIHIDGFEPPFWVHIDSVYVPTGGPIPIPFGAVIRAQKKIDIIEPCGFYEVHWPSGWWPEPCTWWEIMDPETGESTGYEFHVGLTNESCEFHIDAVIPEPYFPPFPWWEIWARRKIPDIKTCDYFVVEEPEDWWPDPCTWWEIIDPFSGEPTGYNFHVDWTNESCEFHIDLMDPGPYIFDFPVPYVYAEKKITNITTCDWFVIVDPVDYLPERCTWWEILDDTGAATGLEFHVDVNDGYYMFHIDGTLPDEVIYIPPSHTITVRKKIDTIQPCDIFRVDDIAATPAPCTWWEVLDESGEPTGWEFHVSDSTPGYFHVDIVIQGSIPILPTHVLTAEKKIDDIQPCDWFVVIDPTTGWVPEPCSWWEITWPREWAGVKFHVDLSGDGMFHIDTVDQPPTPPTPPPFNVTAIPYEPPPLPWYMKAPYPDYAPSGMPDFDQRQWGTYIWQDLMGLWSHCGPTAVANSLWWLDSKFEPNRVPPPAISDGFPLVQSYSPGVWDDHDPQNVPPLVEHLAYLMDCDGLRTGLLKPGPYPFGTNVFDMQAGITHYLSWSGVNPLGDVDGDGIVTINDQDIVTAALGSVPGALGWDLRADIWPETQFGPYVADNVIDMNDLNLVLMNMGLNGLFYEHTVMAPMWDIIEIEVMNSQDVVLLIAPYIDDIRYDESAHYVTVAGLNGTHFGDIGDPWEIVLSDPILDNAEAGGYGDVPVPHVHVGPEPPYTTHNNASLVSHDAYHVIMDPCLGGPLTIIDYPRIGPYPQVKWQIEAAVITCPYAVPDVAVTNVTPAKNVICQGCHGNITVTVENQGTTDETFDVTLYADTTSIGVKAVSLTSGDSTDIVFTWNTTGFSKGNYTISAEAEIVPGEVDTGDNTYIDDWIIVSMLGDITGPEDPPGSGEKPPDGECDMRDVGLVARYFGQDVPPAPAICDLTGPTSGVPDGTVDMRDVGLVARQFGQTDP